MVALLAEGVDRNLGAVVKLPDDVESPSSRRAWIEIAISSDLVFGFTVALLAEGVDRNQLVHAVGDAVQPVALLAEGVDRNVVDNIYFAGPKVALLAEGVDRNLFDLGLTAAAIGRPPRGGRG